MVNPDGAVYVDRLFEGMTEEPIAYLKPRDVLNAIITVAGELGAIVDADNPTLQGELPLDGSRSQPLGGRAAVSDVLERRDDFVSCCAMYASTSARCFGKA